MVEKQSQLQEDERIGEKTTFSIRKRARRFFVHVDRDPNVQAARLELPVCMHEQEIIEAIHANDVVLITGATGTGKTTQVPQFLVEDGFGDSRSPSFKGIVGVTQPRRVAAVSCAKRVAFEMKTEVGKDVGYQIRHQAKFGPETKVKFATDGVLLREAEGDILLKKYSAIVIDEVHERSLNTDLLLSFLSRTVVLRRSQEALMGRLKVIIMSATLDVKGVFTGKDALFRNPPIIKVPSRQYPVTTHFARRTVENYVDEAFKKVCKIHRRLPPGGVLVFLSGRQEVEQLCSKVQEEFGDEKIKIRDCDHPPIGIKVLPFYALLPDYLQKRVFDDVGDDMRKIVVATNVAETSVTIPGIAYVVDSGRVKEKVYKGRGSGLMSSFEIRWVSQAAAEQRTGRAGRTGPGHCYRLYSSAVYDQQFEEYRQPEILRVPADSVVLRLRAMGILHVNKFPFPSKPNERDVSAAEKLLTDLGALYREKAVPSLKLEAKKGAYSGSNVLLGVTRVGRDLAKLPLPPRLGKLLLTASSYNDVLPYACRIAAVLTIGTVLDKAASNFQERHRCLRNHKSDLMTELAAVCAVEHAGRVGEPESGNSKLNTSAMRNLCQQLGIHLKSVLEVFAITNQVEKMFWGSKESSTALRPPDKKLQQQIFRCVLSGFPDRVARRMTRHEAASRGVIPRRQKIAFTVASREDPVFLEGSSPVQLDSTVEFVCFSDLVEVHTPITSKEDEEERDDYDESEGEGDDSDDGSDEKTAVRSDASVVAKGYETESRVVMRGTTVVESEWIVEEATSMCNFRKGKGVPDSASYDKRLETVVEEVAVSYGRHQWPLGTKGVPVNLLRELYGDEIDSDRKRQYSTKFAYALVKGLVRPELRLDVGKNSIEVCVRALGDVLQRYDVFDVVSLKRLFRDRGDCLSSIVEGCGGKRSRDIGKMWRANIARLAEEEDRSEFECPSDEDDEDGKE